MAAECEFMFYEHQQQQLCIKELYQNVITSHSCMLVFGSEPKDHDFKSTMLWHY